MPSQNTLLDILCWFLAADWQKKRHLLFPISAAYRQSQVSLWMLDQTFSENNPICIIWWCFFFAVCGCRQQSSDSHLCTDVCGADETVAAAGLRQSVPNEGRPHTHKNTKTLGHNPKQVACSSHAAQRNKSLEHSISAFSAAIYQ